MAAQDVIDARDLADELTRRDAQRNKMFQAMAAMYHNQWELPEGIAEFDWIRKVISTDPHDAVRAGTRVLSSLDPRIKYTPMLDNEGTRQRANEIETVLKYWLKSAGARKRASVVRDVMLSALLYDCVFMQPTYLPYQKRLAEQEGIGNARNLKMANQYGPFAINVVHPKDCHALQTDLMVEAVYKVSQTPLKSVLSYWGKKAAALEGGKATDIVHVHDVATLDRRVVWANKADEPQSTYTVLLDIPNELPFFSWVARLGGTSLEDEEMHRYAPLLLSVWSANQWDTQNIVESLWISDAIVRAAQPRGIIEGPNPDGVVKDYGEPGGDVKVPPGHKYTPNPQEPIDQGLMAIADRVGSSISKSTVARILQGADLPSNTQFATVNLATQTAVGALKPYKELAEFALGDALAMMLRWIAYMEEAVLVIGKGKEDAGKQYMIDPAEIDVDNLDISVELSPDVPTDRLQRINGASMARQQLGYSQESALEDIGVTDPQKEMRRNLKEKVTETVIQGEMLKIQGAAQVEVQKMQAAVQLEVQKAQMEMQMQMQQQQAQAQQEAQAQAQAQGGAPDQAMLQQMMGSGMDMAAQGMNPAMGGSPPAEANPEAATYEGATGEARNGMEVAE